MPGEQQPLVIPPTTTLPAKFVPSLASLVKAGKTLGEIMEVLNADEKEVRSRLVAAGLLERVGLVAATPPVVVVAGPESKSIDSAIVAAAAAAIESKHDTLTALIGKKFRAVNGSDGRDGFHIEVKDVEGHVMRVEWIDGPGAGGSFKLTGAELLVQFEEYVDGTVVTPATTFKPRTRKPRAVAPPTTPAAPPPQGAPAPLFTPGPAQNAPVPSDQAAQITETQIAIPAVELTDAAAMALGRLAAIGMNSNVAVTKILEWARVVLDAQKKTTHAWVRP